MTLDIDLAKNVFARRPIERGAKHQTSADCTTNASSSILCLSAGCAAALSILLVVVSI